MKKLLIIILVAVVLGSVGYFAYTTYNNSQESETVQAAYETIEAEYGSLTSLIGATGTVRSKQAANLLWKTTGTVGDVYAEVGEYIEAGEILAELNQTSLPQNVILAQAELVQAQQALDELVNSDPIEIQVKLAHAQQAITDAQEKVITAEREMDEYEGDGYEYKLDRAKQDVEDALEDLEQAKKDLDPYLDRDPEDSAREHYEEELAGAERDHNEEIRKLEELKIEKLIAEQNLETAYAELENTTAEYEEITEDPNPDDIAAAKARIAAAEATLSQAWIEAPFSGTIMVAEPLIGDQVSPEVYAFRLDDLSSMFVDLDVSEIDINQVELGQDVNVTFDAIRGEEYSGEVVDVGLVGRLSQGVVYYTVTVEIQDPDEAIRPGMTSAVDIIINKSDEALLVPNQAIRVEDGIQVVYIIDGDGTLMPVKILLGVSSDTFSQVLEGDLEAGDLIVLNPQLNAGIEEINFFSDDPEDMRRMRELRDQFEPTDEGT